MKKFISFLICALMLVSVFVFPSISSAQDYSEAYALMNALGVFNGENTPKAGVKRKQMAVYVNRITKYEELSDNLFYDVPGTLPETGAINSAAKYGYMIGDGGCFYPEREVTFKEAVTVLLRVAGYTKPAISSGDYSAGYLKWANSSGLLKGISEQGDELNEGILARLMYNLMDINIVGALSYGQNGIAEEKIDKETTVLNEFFDTVKVKGRVMATPNVSAAGYSPCDTSQVVINTDGGDVYYKRNGVDYDDKLAVNAEFYIYGSEEEIIYAEYKYSGVTEVKFSGDDIEKLGKSLFSISYRDSQNRLKTIDTSKAAFIYNGRNLDEITVDMVKTDFSVIECRDVGGDGKYDVVYVWDYDVVLVDSINFSSHKINDKITGTSIDFDPDKYELSVKMNGRDFNISAVKEYYTLLAARSMGEDDFKLRIEVFPDCVGGTLTALSDGESIDIDGESFNIRDSFTKLYSPSLKGEYIVGIDFDGNALCMLKSNYWPQKYGYAMSVGKTKHSRDDIAIRLFTEDNRFETLQFAKKFKLNGEKADYDKLTLSGLFTDGEFTEQLISYKTDKDGLITNINVAQEGEPEETGAKSLTLNRTFSRTAQIADDYFNIYNNTALFSTEYVGIEGITKSFRIMKNGDEFIEDEFLVGTASQMGVSEGVFDIKVYDSSYERVAGAAVYTVYKEQLSAGDSDVYGFLVSKVRHTKNADDESVIEITGYTQGKEISFTENELIDFKNVRCGDILATWGSQTKLTAYNIMFSLDESTTAQEYMDYDSSSDEFFVLNKKNLMQVRLSGFFREIVSKSPSDGNLFLTKTRKTDTLRPVTCAAYTNYYIYDTKEKNVSVASKSDIDTTCKNVYFVTTYGVARDVIIYK